MYDNRDFIAYNITEFAEEIFQTLLNQTIICIRKNKNQNIQDEIIEIHESKKELLTFFNCVDDLDNNLHQYELIGISKVLLDKFSMRFFNAIEYLYLMKCGRIPVARINLPFHSVLNTDVNQHIVSKGEFDSTQLGDFQFWIERRDPYSFLTKSNLHFRRLRIQSPNCNQLREGYLPLWESNIETFGGYHPWKSSQNLIYYPNEKEVIYLPIYELLTNHLSIYKGYYGHSLKLTIDKEYSLKTDSRSILLYVSNDYERKSESTGSEYYQVIIDLDNWEVIDSFTPSFGKYLYY